MSSISRSDLICTDRRPACPNCWGRCRVGPSPTASAKVDEGSGRSFRHRRIADEQSGAMPRSFVSCLIGADGQGDGNGPVACPLDVASATPPAPLRCSFCSKRNRVLAVAKPPHQPIGFEVRLGGECVFERPAQPRSPFRDDATGAAPIRSAAVRSRAARNSLSALQFGHSRELASRRPTWCTRLAVCATPRQSQSACHSSLGWW